MPYRTVQIAWLPRTAAGWTAFTSARLEAGRLWSAMVTRHARLRRLAHRYGWRWPGLSRWQKWAKGRFPGLSAQSVQQIVAEFCEAISSTTAARKRARAAGHDPSEVRYPWRLSRYHDVNYTNQEATVADGKLRLPNGRQTAALYVRLPEGFELPGRLMEVRLSYGKVALVCKLADDAPVSLPIDTPVVGVDLGVNTLLAATDGTDAILVSGREAKATIQWRAKNLASISAAQAPKVKGSRRHRRLQRRKHRPLDKAAARVKDITHKATRAVVNAFPGARMVVGKPFNDAARKMGRKQAQQVSTACNRRIIFQLDYKAAGGAGEVNEAYSSQTCPVCGCRNKCRRTYRCKGCGFVAPRDVVGSANIRCIGMAGSMVPDPAYQAPRTRFVRPLKYPGRRSPPQGDTARPGSSPGQGACSSAKAEKGPVHAEA